MNEKMKVYILSNWAGYDMVDSMEEMVRVLNILEAHGETLDSLHDVTMGNKNQFCGIWFNSNPDTDRKVKETLYEYNIFYHSRDELIEVISEDAEDYGVSVEELLKDEDIRVTADGIVRVLRY